MHNNINDNSRLADEYSRVVLSLIIFKKDELEIDREIGKKIKHLSGLDAESKGNSVKKFIGGLEMGKILLEKRKIDAEIERAIKKAQEIVNS